MSEPMEVVTGQALARDILGALDRGETPDWAAFDRAYRKPLLRQAASRLQRLDLHRRFTPEDALHDFLQHRIYPPRQARNMFAPSARGERQLLPRLLTSLAHRCVDLARRAGAGREWGENEERLANAPAPAEPRLPDYEEVESLVLQQLDAIRRACAPRRRPRGAAYREALLVRLRLDWAGGFDGVELRSEEDDQPVVLNLPLLEQLTAWTDEEAATPLVEGGPPLGQFWQEVRATLLLAPDRQVGIDRLAPLVPVGRDLWNQWVSRGRRKVQEHLGADYRRVFAMWDDPAEGA
jgi:hypothetical protein